MKEQQREYEFTSILNHPEDYSEEELRTFFSQPENKADYRLYRLAQMAGNREQVALPDVDRAWLFPLPSRKYRLYVCGELRYSVQWLCVQLSFCISMCLNLLLRMKTYW